METLFYLISNAFRVILYFAFFSTFYSKKRVPSLLIWIYGILFFAVNSFCYLYWNIPVLNTATTMLFLFGTCLLYCGKWQQYIFLPIIQAGIMTASETLSVFILMINTAQIQEFNAGISVTLSNLLYFMILIFIRHFKTENVKLPFQYWFVLLLIPALSILIHIVMIYQFTISPLQYTAVSAFIFLINISIFWLYHKLAEYFIKANQTKIMEEMSRSYREQVASIYNSEKKNDKIRHDISGHFTVLQALIADAKLDDAEQYIQTLNQDIKSISKNLITGDIVIDSILNSYKHKSESSGIKYTVQTYIPSKNRFDETDICSILSNLLNNALEAQTFFDAKAEKKITVELSKNNNIWIINIQNSCNPNLFVRTGQVPKTTKNDRLMHGIGLQNVISCAEKYSGHCIFEASQGLFTSCVYLTEPDKDTI